MLIDKTTYDFDADPSISTTLWTPADISTIAWYDANDVATITESAGLVSQWDDKSTNGYHMVQGTGSKQPAYTTDKITFTSDSLHVTTGPTLSTPHSVFIISDYAGANTNNQYLFDSTGRSVIGESGTSGWGIYNGAWLWSTGLNPINETIISAVFNSTSSAVYHDGTSVLSGNSGSGQMSGKLVLGDSYLETGGAYFNGFLREVIIIDNADTTTRQKIEGYLAWKWSLEANLPSGHPYEFSAPTV